MYDCDLSYVYVYGMIIIGQFLLKDSGVFLLNYFVILLEVHILKYTVKYIHNSFWEWI